MQHSLAQWKAALERAECLCAEMLKVGLPSCCARPATELSVDDQATASLKKRYSTAGLESTEKLAPEVTISDQRACSKIVPSSKACCSSSATARTKSPSMTGPSIGASCPLDAKSTQCDVLAPTPKFGFPCNSSNRSVQALTAQHGTSSEGNPIASGHQSLVPAAIDLEKGLAVEHAVTQISGMTCTGCERKLQHVLSNIAGVRNVQTSLVLGRAEFDVDAGVSINEVASLLERQTEFRCIVREEGHRLEVLIPGPSPAPTLKRGTTAVASEKDSALLLRALAGPNYPSGVEDVKIMDSKGRKWKPRDANHGLVHRLGVGIAASKPHKYSARISYNPRVVGARDLLERGFDVPLSLASLSSDHATATETKHLRETLYMTLLSALLTIPVLIMAWAPLPPHKIGYESSSLALATLVQVVIAGPFYPKALKALLFSGIIEMDLLIVISTTTAYVYSVVAFVYETIGNPLSTGGFFETSTLLVTLIMCGRLASAYTRRKAADSISVQALQPTKALLSENGKERLIDIREFQYGDLFKVLPDTVVPTDGIVVSGETDIDESMITGEAIPVPKLSGGQIIAGSINKTGPIVARLTKLPIDNTISRIAAMVDEARLSKPRIQETADRVASYFVPCVLVLTVVVFLIWIAVGLAVRDTSASDAIVTAITYALAALIVSCPCAIGLAVPMVMVIAGGVGAKHGVIFKSPRAIEDSRRASHVIFDKTGTLTQGQFEVVEEVYRGENWNQAASIAKQLTASSKHPVSQALTKHLESLGKGLIELESISSAVGKGMQATLEGQMVRGGNPLYTDAVEDPDVQRLLYQGLTVFCLRYGSALLAIFGLRDALRSDTASVISTLQAQGILVSIVSGDSSTVVNRLASDLAIPLSHVKGQCTPEDKVRYVASLSTPLIGSKKTGSTTTTIFCGDGTNDAAALARADIGIYMAGGTQVAKSAADVVLTHASLSGILALMNLSRASMRRVYLNFTWCFVYNFFAILLAAGAFVTARIPPPYAGLGELVSVLPVIAVAMQLQWIKIK
ncbi:MAG: hypothetical protein Q9197_005189 [Variospora fuerteventurae]